MLQEPTVVHSESESQSTIHFVHALMQFALTVRYRIGVVYTSLLVTGLLAGLYFATATRYYGATAALLVMQTGADMLPTSVAADSGRQQSKMTTFAKLITTAKVVEGALEYLRPEDCIDMAKAPREKWDDVLRDNLSARTVRDTNIIQINYRSKDPRAAVAVVNAVVQSYTEFLDRTYKGTAREIIQVLTREQAGLAEKLAAKETEVLQARREYEDLGIRSDGRTVHPLVQRAISFNEALVDTQKQRMELEASLAAIQAAIRNGGDLKQHVMAVANVVGNEMLLRGLGINTHNAATLDRLGRDLLEMHASLRTLQEHYGPRHPEVIAKNEQIRMTEAYLAGYQERISQRLDEIQNAQLGPMLAEMVQQRLNEAWKLETSLQVKFEQAKAEAISLNAQLAHLEIIEHDLQWLRNLHDVLADRIANIDLKQDGQDVRTAVLQDPVIDNRPISPSLRNTCVLALLAGLTAGLLLVYAIDILDDRFRSIEEMQGQLGVSALAMVRPLSVSETSGIGALEVHTAPDSAESEAFRTLRTALALADREARRIVVSSAEPGDGKTTILANLAVSYAQSKKKTLLIDADLRRPGLTTMLEMRGVDGLSSVIRGRDDVVRMASAHIRSSGIANMDVLPSGPRPSNPAELLASSRFSELLAWAESVYDEILIDSPPALATSDAAVIGRLVDGLLLVVQPHKNRRRMVLRAAESFHLLKIPVLGIVVNRVGSQEDRGYYGYSSGYGYSYSYAEKYGDDEMDTIGDDLAQAEGDSLGEDAAEMPHHGNGNIATAIVPRRVA